MAGAREGEIAKKASGHVKFSFYLLSANMKNKQLTLSHVESRKQERERERERVGLLKGFTPTLNKTETAKLRLDNIGLTLHA